MIRRSLLVAGVAVILSLLIHGLGLSLSREAEAPSGGQEETEVTDLGGTFEDFVEPLEEAAPPEVTPPDPIVEEPTSQALVASDNPQNVLAPDTGDAEPTQPDEAEALDAEGGLAQTDAPAGGPDEVAEAADAGEIVEPDVAEPEGVAEGEPDPAEAEPEIAEPLQAEEPQITITSVPDEPEILTAEEEDPLATAAVTRSLRPPAERPTAEALGVPERTQQRSAQRSTSTGTIQSPLTAYRHSGVDLLALGRIEQRAGAGSSGSRGPGNASTTNYVGRILVQLNNSPKVNTAETGTARVSFQINTDGSLAWVRVLTARGTSGIERAARAQVQRAAPFPRPPSGTPQRLVFVYQNN